jgi:hypothetical protein
MRVSRETMEDKGFIMKRIIVFVFIGLAISVTSAFAQTDSVRVFENSNNFAEIKSAFQRRLHSASLEYKYFFHIQESFDFEDGPEGEIFDKEAKTKIGKRKYFIFEASEDGVYFLFLVNKKDSRTIGFFFINDEVEEAIQCSDVEIKKALALYPDL